MNHGYLLERGWLNTLTQKKAVDKDLNPIPWLSYPAIDFIEQYIPANASIFEYGSGYSTLYFSKKFAHITSVDNDLQWHNKILSLTTGSTNCKIIFSADEQTYVDSIEGEATMKYDFILIDGRWRNKCVYKAVNYIKSKGVIMLDDVEREYYSTAVTFLKNQQFIPIPLIGMSPMSFESHHTMAFIRL
jgi:hypothetical protein